MTNTPLGQLVSHSARTIIINETRDTITMHYLHRGAVTMAAYVNLVRWTDPNYRCCDAFGGERFTCLTQGRMMRLDFDGDTAFPEHAILVVDERRRNDGDKANLLFFEAPVPRSAPEKPLAIVNAEIDSPPSLFRCDAPLVIDPDIAGVDPPYEAYCARGERTRRMIGVRKNDTGATIVDLRLI